MLEAALPRAQQILGSARAAAEQAQATVEELHATELRVDQLRVAAADARQQLELAAPPQRVDLPGLVRAYGAAEAAVAGEDAAIRRSFGWDVSIQGGYSRVFGAREDVPLFGMISVSFSPGLLFQRGPEARAVAGRRAAALREVNGLPDRVEQLRRRLGATRQAERLRLEEATVLLADLEARLASVQAVEGERARRYAEYLWFDLVRIKAEHEYLRVHLRELTALLGDGARAG